MKSFEVNFAAVVLRFYLMMGIIILAFFIGLPWLSFLALPLFFSAILGIRVSSPTKKGEAKMTQMSRREQPGMTKVS